MKKQAGLELLDGNKVKLYNTVIFDKQGPDVFLAHGGWVTQSTAKAINASLYAHSVPGKVFRRAGNMYYKGPNGHVTEIESYTKKVRVY